MNRENQPDSTDNQPDEESRLRRAIRVLLIPLLYAVLLAVMTYPWVMHLTDRFPSDWSSPAFMSLLVNHCRVLASDPLAILNAPFMYPVESCLALTENVIGYTVFFAPFYLLTRQAILATNLTVWLSFVLSATAFFYCARYYVRHWAAAFVGGIVFGLISFRIGNVDDVTMSNLACFPLAVLFLEKGLRYGRWRHFFLLSLCFVFQVYSCLYLGAMLAMFLVIFGVARAKDILNKTTIRRLTASILLAVLMILPLAWIYVHMRHAYSYEQWEGTTKWLGLDIIDYVRVLPNNVLYKHMLPVAKNPLVERFCVFPGLIATALAGYGLTSREVNRRARFAFIVTGIVLFVFSLGMYLKVGNRLTSIPLPYMAVLAVCSYLRCAWRFIFVFMLSFAWFTAVGLDRLIARHPRRAGILSLVAIALIVAEHLNVPTPLYRMPEKDEPIYGHIDGPVLEYPTYFEESTRARVFLDQWRREFIYTYNQISHGHPIVNCAVSYNCRPRLETNRMAQDIPSLGSLRFFAALGVKYIVVNKHLFFPGERPYNPQEFDVPSLMKVNETDNRVLYRITDTPKVVEDLEITYAFSPVDAGTSLLTLSATPPDGSVWVNPNIAKVETVDVAVLEETGSYRDAHTVSFSLPLVIMTNSTTTIPIAGTIPSQGDLQVHFTSRHLKPVARD